MALTFTKVISSSPSGLVVEASDGKTYTVTGDRSQRNNNPGAIAYSPVAVANGAIGYDTINIGGRPSTRIAVFPDLASGQAAQQELLFGSGTNHPAYRDMTVSQAISKYAPGGVDGNPQPTSYYTRIADSLGVSPDTKLSDLTQQQQQAFMQVQAGIEGSRPQRIIDAQGNPAQFPWTNSAGSLAGPRPAPPSTFPSRPNLPTPPLGGVPLTNGQGGPNGLYASDYMPPPPRVDPRSGFPSFSIPALPTSPITPPGYNTVTDAQRTAMAQLPPPPPIPATRPSGLGAPPPPVPQMATTSTGKTIQVGKNYDIGGKQYIGGINAQGIGTLTKVTSPLSMAAPGTIAGGIVGKALGGALSTAGTNLQNAAGVAGQDITGGLTNVRNAVAGGAQNAVSGVGNFLSGIFGSGGNSSPPVVAPNSSGSPDERGTAPASFIPPRPTPAPWPTYTPTPQAATGNTIPSPPPVPSQPWQYAPTMPNSSGSPDDRNINPPAPPSIWANTTSQPIPAPWNTNFAPQSIAGPTTQSVQVANPAYRTWVESYGDAAQAAARTANPMGGPNGLSAADFAPPSIVPTAPPQTITIRRPVASPSSPSQAPSPPPAQQVRLASGSMANVGQTFTANGYSYRVNADGSTTNTSTGHTYGTPTPTNNLAISGYYNSSPQEAQTRASAEYSSPAAVTARNALHPGQVGEWVSGMPIEWRGTVNPTVPRTLPGYPAPSSVPVIPASAPPPIPQSQPSAPVISPPRYNGHPPVAGGPQAPGSDGAGWRWGNGAPQSSGGPSWGQGNPSNGSPNPDMLQKIMARMANQTGGYQ